MSIYLSRRLVVEPSMCDSTIISFLSLEIFLINTTSLSKKLRLSSRDMSFSADNLLKKGYKFSTVGLENSCSKYFRIANPDDSHFLSQQPSLTLLQWSRCKIEELVS